MIAIFGALPTDLQHVVKEFLGYDEDLLLQLFQKLKHYQFLGGRYNPNSKRKSFTYKLRLQNELLTTKFNLRTKGGQKKSRKVQNLVHELVKQLVSMNCPIEITTCCGRPLDHRPIVRCPNGHPVCQHRPVNAIQSYPYPVLDDIYSCHVCHRQFRKYDETFNMKTEEYEQHEIRTRWM